MRLNDLPAPPYRDRPVDEWPASAIRTLQAYRDLVDAIGEPMFAWDCQLGVMQRETDR
jgi:hypothetical protein